MKSKILIVCICVLIVVISLFIHNYFYVNKLLENINLTKAKKLMIVTHPDDETIWGGAHLLDGNYLVICITCGTNVTRSNEFKKVMKYTKNQYIMLGYPDKVNGNRSDWSESENDIYKDIKNIIKAKKWDLIVTHNRKGEYGHIQHKKISEIVTNVYNELQSEEDLYYFGNYYTKKQILKYEEYLTPLSEEKAQIKINKLIKIYTSQEFIKNTFNHMFPYEMWQKYENNLIAGE